MSIATIEEETVDVNVRLNQVVTQQFFRTSSLGIALNFQRLGGYVLQGWTIRDCLLT